MWIVSPLFRSLYLSVARVLVIYTILWLPASAHATSSIGLTPDGTTVFVVNPDSALSQRLTPRPRPSWPRSSWGEIPASSP